MKKHIVCHYKNGALLFCTNESFPPGIAKIVLDIFNQQGLVSLLEQENRNFFKVVGKVNLNYDPFASSSTTKWDDVISKMSITLGILEERVKPLFASGSDLNYRRAAS